MKKILFVSCLFVLSISTSFSITENKADGVGTFKLMNVAIFLPNGVELLDFAGPGEAFQTTDDSTGQNLFRVYTVGKTKDKIKSRGFLDITPEFSIEDCPKPDIVVLPGGGSNTAANDKDIVAWIKKCEQDSAILLSVCTGALILAKAGLLDNKSATTHWCCTDRLKEYAPTGNIVFGKRYVDNGNIITTEGVSAGIDGALYLISKLCGKEIADNTAHYMMYNWTPEKF